MGDQGASARRAGGERRAATPRIPHKGYVVPVLAELGAIVEDMFERFREGQAA